MRVLVVGSGAREHALVRAFQADPGVSAVVCAPGNDGMAAEGVDCRYIGLRDVTGIAEMAVATLADLVVVGPEVPLVAGAADAIRAAGHVPCFGPSAAAARLEGSKAFAKEVMASAGVPTARPFVCETSEEVEAALGELGAPHVVKDDGLAAGKGVVVTDDRRLALEHARECLAGPGRGGKVVVEEYLDGPEVSVFAVCDGTDAVALAPAQDYKRLLDGDEGPNTGGMGAYSPLPWLPEGLADEVLDRVVRPVLAELARHGTPFVGLLYVGCALTSDGVKVVEFNVRFGDPEAQVVLARLRTPLGPLLLAAAEGRLAAHVAEVGGVEHSDDAAVAVVLAADGYPVSPRSGDVVHGLPEAAAVPGAHLLYAGLEAKAKEWVTTGGRLVTVVGTGPDLPAARGTAYRALDLVAVEGGHARRDIAADR